MVALVASALAAAATHDPTDLWYAAAPLGLLLQCAQRIEVGGARARRVGLHAVELDLSTAVIAAPGRTWWRELCFLGRPFELRDAHGRRLCVESWLWPAELRDVLRESVCARTRS